MDAMSTDELKQMVDEAQLREILSMRGQLLELKKQALSSANELQCVYWWLVGRTTCPYEHEYEECCGSEKTFRDHVSKAISILQEIEHIQEVKEEK